MKSVGKMLFDTPKSVHCPLCGEQHIKSTHTEWEGHAKNLTWTTHTVFFECGCRVKYFPDGSNEIRRSCE